mgnify:FL=1
MNECYCVFVDMTVNADKVDRVWREALVGIYKDENAAFDAVDELENSGWAKLIRGFNDALLRFAVTPIKFGEALWL